MNQPPEAIQDGVTPNAPDETTPDLTKACSPFVVPPFSPPPPIAVSYVWWSWHPCYPYWAQSCWKAATIEEAQRYLTDPRASLTVYHNKLIRHDGITLTEVQDVPCQEMDVWHKIKRQMFKLEA